MSDPDSDPISDLFGELNQVLDDYGFKGTVEGIAKIDVVVTYGPIQHETFLRVRVGEDGWQLVDKADQMQRLRREILDQQYDTDE
jgi:hypothetical protein